MLEAAIDTSITLPVSGVPDAMAASKNDPKKLEETTQQFEAIFLRQFLGQALKPLLHKPMGSQVAGAGIYQQMVTEVIAENLAKGGEFGFSSMLQSQLVGKPAVSETENLLTDKDLL